MKDFNLRELDMYVVSVLHCLYSREYKGITYGFGALCKPEVGKMVQGHLQVGKIWCK